MSVSALIRTAALDDAPALASLHASAFPTPWPETDLQRLLLDPRSIGLICDGQGFIVVKVAGDEAEVITLAVDPTARRQGVGRALVEAGAAAAKSAGANALFLEVADDNGGAIALYEGAGFQAVGRRRGYYSRPDGRMDARVLRRALIA